MTSLQQRLQDDVKAAMRAGNKADLEVLRVLLSDVKKIVIDSGAAGDEAGDDVVLKVLQRAAKTRAESVEAFTKGGRPDLADRERAQIAIVQRYLPVGASEAEIAKVVDAVIAETGAQGKAAMGRVMKEVLARLGGRAEGGAVSKVVATRLT
jgi:uncharacterized protein YqeY